uniref:mannose-1-phosphate guanylyltransferase/mannose-6-phosphate isomerase n=1 Tax=Phocaeicola sp. TaxID=2773926 RepID=UPI003AB36199
MTNSNNYCVIMGGGIGSRFWPYSRKNLPKQFLDFFGTGRSLIQQTFDRYKKIVPIENIFITTNVLYKELVQEQLPELDKSQILLEPTRRSTAPCIAWASYHIKKFNPNANVIVAPSDHLILKEDEFKAAILKGLEFVSNSPQLLTLGIKPNRPETGYGYIRRGEVSAGEQDTVAFEVAQFVEKPNLETAQAYVASGEYYWNSGMFLFRAGRYLEELKKYRPDILDACEKAMSAVDPDLDFIRVNEEAFLACPEESVDYAVMERTADAVVVPMDAGWSDVGSWSSLWEISAHTAEGNVCHGDVINHKTENSYVYAESGLVTTVGVKDLVVVQTKDAVLIADRNAVQDVKKVVEQIKADGRHEHRVHREVYRPWGKYDSIDAGDRYQ